MRTSRLSTAVAQPAARITQLTSLAEGASRILLSLFCVRPLLSTSSTISGAGIGIGVAVNALLASRTPGPSRSRCG